MAQKTVLGKGLASLLPGAAASISATPSAAPSNHAGLMAGNQDRHPGIALLPVDELSVNDYQPRRSFDDSTLQELAQSIKTNGLIQPLIVRRTTSGYQLIAGERRLRASKLAGLRQVPVVVRRSTDREALEMALIENIQREDLNCIDEALAYRQLMEEFQLTQEEAATRVGKERASVANHLRLLRLPEEIVNDL
ncbi:ParB/RepB/Spo0J family partition protein, partial [bacterium]|nr:ParB/RepB/Spo0J family partition protein [bacterium]